METIPFLLKVKFPQGGEATASLLFCRRLKNEWFGQDLNIESVFVMKMCLRVVLLKNIQL